MKIKNIEQYRDRFSQKWSELHNLNDPSYLYDPIKHIIQSEGKRFRPIIVQFLGDISVSYTHLTLPTILLV